MRKTIILCIIIQVVSCSLLGILMVTRTSNPFNENELSAIGQLLTSLDLAFGLVVYYQSGKQLPNRVLLVFPAFFGSLYFFWGGAMQIALSYQFISMVIVGLFVFRRLRSGE